MDAFEKTASYLVCCGVFAKKKLMWLRLQQGRGSVTVLVHTDAARRPGAPFGISGHVMEAADRGPANKRHQQGMAQGGGTASTKMRSVYNRQHKAARERSAELWQ